MKKKFVCAMLMAMCLTFGACGKDVSPEESSQEQTESSASKKSESNKTEASEESKVDDEIAQLYSEVREIYSCKVYYNYNRKYREHEYFFDQFFMTGSKVVPIMRYYEAKGYNEYYNKPAFEGGLDDIWDYYNDGYLFIGAGRDQSYLVVENNEFLPMELQSQEDVKVHDIDTKKFTATATHKDGNLYIVGYMFMLNDSPFMLTDVIFNDDGDEALRKQAEEEVDIMMTTVRTKK